MALDERLHSDLGIGSSAAQEHFGAVKTSRAYGNDSSLGAGGTQQARDTPGISQARGPPVASVDRSGPANRAGSHPLEHRLQAPANRPETAANRAREGVSDSSCQID